MSAAEYYNSRPEGTGGGEGTGKTVGGGGSGNGSGGDIGDSSGISHSASQYDKKDNYNNNDNYGYTSYTEHQNHNPYQNTSNYSDLTPSHETPPPDAPYLSQTQPHGQHSQESTSSIAGKYTDPYADNIPLNDRPNRQSTAYNPNALPPPAHSKPFIRTKRRRSWFCYIMGFILIVIFIMEIVKNFQLTGSIIATHPSFNPMIGPSPYVIINMGSRYVPCMQRQDAIANADVTISFPCPNITTGVPECTLSQLCGFNGTPSQAEMKNGASPNQWFRFIIPMFLHAGIIHILFNMLLLLTLGKQLEEEIGALRFALVYFACGIFGFILGGNFAPVNISSVGASGALFGILALNLLDLLYTWNDRKLMGENPVKELIWVIAELAFAFVLGLFPGLDNFAHIGGFIMGILLGLTVLHSPSGLRKRIGVDEPPYAPVFGRTNAAGNGSSEFAGGVATFVKNPVGFFKGRKGLWWAWWLVRAGALVAAVVVTVVLLNNFYVNRKECNWCRYLSCLPVKDWCDIGKLQIEKQSAKRWLMREL